MVETVEGLDIEPRNDYTNLRSVIDNSNATVYSIDASASPSSGRQGLILIPLFALVEGFTFSMTQFQSHPTAVSTPPLLLRAAFVNDAPRGWLASLLSPGPPLEVATHRGRGLGPSYNSPDPLNSRAMRIA